MKILILILLIASPILINAQAVRIPDPAFKQRIIALGFDENDNGKIEVAEAENVTDLDLNNVGIVNLEGINGFTNLKELQIAGNKISKLDVSNLKKLTGLYAYDNPLTEINVSGLTQLENLFIHNNGGQYGLLRSFVKTLDVSTLTNLKDLRCSRNLITQMNISGLNKLERLECGTNRIETVALTKTPNLKYVDLKENPLKVTVDIRGLVNLEYFNCEGCELLFLNMSGTIKLKELFW